MKSHRRLPKNLNFVNRKRKKGPLLQSHSTGCSSPALERNSNRTSSSEQRNGFHQNLLSSWLCARILTKEGKRPRISFSPRLHASAWPPAQSKPGLSAISSLTYIERKKKGFSLRLLEAATYSVYKRTAAVPIREESSGWKEPPQQYAQWLDFGAYRANRSA